MTARLIVTESRAMTSEPIRDPLADHLITPQNSLFVFIDYQPEQLATVRSMDRDLLVKNAVSTVRAVKAFGVPVVHSTVNVSSGQTKPTLPELADAIASNLASYGHPTATVPMGGPRDPWAVVDSHGSVKGIDGLRVVDASIMPDDPSVALNPTTIMIAERIAKTVYAAEPGLGAREVQVA